MPKRNLRWYGAVALVAVLSVATLMIACQGAPGETGPAGPTGPAAPAGSAGPAGPPGTAVCSECHDDTTLILAKRLQWEQSVHATGGAYVRGTSASCAGCHSGEGFVARIAAGIDPTEVKEGVTNPTPPNCRTCHKIHTTYTEADFALRTEVPVTLYVSGKTFDMGEGNLCVNCHQPRSQYVEVGMGDIEVTSTHWGPHHGPQSTVFLGLGGYGVDGSPSMHYNLVTEGCPVCHMVNDRHEMEPNVAACQSCHGEVEDFDIDGLQTEVEALFEELGELLEAEGVLHDGHPVVGTYPEALAGALWNYLVVYEDSSLGVHNPEFVKAILEKGIELLK